MHKEGSITKKIKVLNILSAVHCHTFSRRSSELIWEKNKTLNII